MDGPNGTGDITRFVKQTIPNFLKNVIAPKMVQWEDRLSKNFGLIVYICVVHGSWFVIFTEAYPLITNGSERYVSLYHKQIGYFVFIACITSWLLSSCVSPGNITKETMQRYDNYPYDNLLFVENKICPTLNIRKIARSKYDRYTNRHIPRFDHYCIWLKTPIGEENYRFFILFLMVHAFMCCYGSIIVGKLFWGEMLDSHLLTRTMIRKLIVTVYIMMTKHIYLAAVYVLMIVMSFLLAAFLGFHLYIVSKNMTTNEFYKWREIKWWHRCETEKYKWTLKYGKATTNEVAASTTIPDTSSKIHHGSIAIPNDDEVEVRCTNIQKSESDLSMALRNRTKFSEASGKDEEVATNARKNESMINPGPMPRNIYNLGIIQNILEVLFPRSKRKMKSRLKII